MRLTLDSLRVRPLMRGALFTALLYAALLPFALAVQSCVRLSPAGAIEVHARAALEMAREFVDPIYELAVQSCKDQQTAVYLAALDGGDMPTARTKLSAIQDRCRKTTAAFDEIRTWHDQASALVEDGKIEDAERVIDQIREALRTITQRVHAP